MRTNKKERLRLVERKIVLIDAAYRIMAELLSCFDYELRQAVGTPIDVERQRLIVERTAIENEPAVRSR